MSVVTTLALMHDEFSRKADELRVHLRQFDANGGRYSTPWPVDLFELHHSDHFKGGKCAESEVWTGAFNHFDIYGFCEHLEAFNWYSPGLVCLVANVNGEVLYTWKPGHQVQATGETGVPL